MRISRMPGNLCIRILCVLTALLMLAGCADADEQETQHPTEEIVAAQTSLAAEHTEETVDTAAEPETVVQTESESEPGETMVTEPKDTESTAETESTVPEEETVSEETVPEETELSPELIAAQEEKQALEAELEALTETQEKTQRNGIILAVAAAVVLIAALVFLYLWRRADAALKKARKRIPVQNTDVRVSQIKIGKVHGIGGRNNQQDSFSVSPAELYSQNGVLAVVADGMGGLENGDKASQAAVISVMEGFYGISGTGTERLLGMLTAAKSAVDAVKADCGYSECGTTLVMGLIQDGQFHHVSVGDSRIYLYRGRSLIHLNREHSYLFDQVKRAVNGEISPMDAISNEKSGCITSFLGMDMLHHIDIPASPVCVLPGDKFLLLSDGVYNALTQEEICLAMRHPAQDAAEAIESFIRTKNFQDQDNYTAVILECR